MPISSGTGEARESEMAFFRKLVYRFTEMSGETHSIGGCKEHEELATLRYFTTSAAATFLALELHGYVFR